MCGRSVRGSGVWKECEGECVRGVCEEEWCVEGVCGRVVCGRSV